MTMRRWLTSVSIVACLTWGVCAGQGAPPQLIATDQELSEYLTRAERLIDEGSYELAIEILQSILSRSDVGFVSTDSRHFYSLWLEVRQTIGQLPPDGAALYRALYDPPAERLYEQAVAAGDVAGLGQIVAEYHHTAAGAKALDSLAQHAFDHADFARAGRQWGRMLALDITDEASSLALARMAVAHHFAQAPEASDAALARLLRAFPGSQGVVGGKEQALAGFVVRMRQLPARAGEARQRTDWPGLGGVPNGVGIMADCATPEAPIWQYPPAGEKGMLVPLEAAITAWQNKDSSYGHYYGGEPEEMLKVVLKIRDGQAVAQYTVGEKVNTMALPAIVQPALAGDTLLFRDADKIIALDVRSGEQLWDKAFPAEVAPPDDQYVRGYYGPTPDTSQAIFDSGYYSLTVSDDKIFAVGESLSAAGQASVQMMSAYSEDAVVTKPTVLSAFSISRQGEEIWSTKRASDDDIELRHCAFISPPTIYQGRLYVLAVYMDAYQLYCLDAASGSLIWRSFVSQIPVVISGRGRPLDLSLAGMLHRGSPPAVADGRVVALTNTGVVSAFDSETGRALWAYQYDSRVNDPANLPGDRMMYVVRRDRGTADRIVRPPTNPVIMTGGRVLLLPADGDDLLCLTADTGRPLWRKARHGQHHLSALDSERALLSGPGLMVCSAAGEMVFDGNVSDIIGRPAVMRSAVMLSGRGKLYRLDLSAPQFAATDLTSSILPDSEAITGNLISAGGRLIASSALGVRSYVDGQVVRDEIARKLPGATPAEQLAMYYERGWLAFYTRRYEEAYEDFLACEKLVDSLGVPAPAQLQSKLYQCSIGWANQADGPEQMIARFELADTYAQSEQELAHNSLRKAKYYVSMGQFDKAVTLAHKIADRYDGQALVDVAIGPEANAARFTEHLPRVDVAELIHGRFLPDMIDKYGQGSYAIFDAKASQALAAAQAAGEPSAMLTVAVNWPNSMWADDALYAAAEVYYLRAGEATDDEQLDLTAKASHALMRVANWPGSPLAAPAQIALAVIYSRQHKDVLVADACLVARDLARRLVGDEADAVPVSFADVQGTLGELIEAITSGELADSTEDRLPEPLTMPLDRKFVAAKDGRAILSGAGTPLLIDGDVLLLADGHLMRVGLTGANADSAVRWRCELPAVADVADAAGQAPPGPRPIGRRGESPPAARVVGVHGVLDEASKTLAVAAGLQVVGVDIDTGELQWRASLAELAIGDPVAVGSGAGVILIVSSKGQVSCVSAGSGKVQWRSSLGREAATTVEARIAGTLAIVTDRSGKMVKCYDLQTDGKEVRLWRGKSAVSTVLIGDAMLAVMIDGYLAAYALTDLDESLWERKFPADSSAAVLWGSRAGVVVGYAGRGASRLEVLSPQDGHTISRTETAPIMGKAATVLDVSLQEGMLYAFCTPVDENTPPLPTATKPGQPVFIQKFDLAGGEMQWQRDYTPESPGQRDIFPPIFSGEYILTGFGDDGRAYILSLDDGRPVAGGRFESVVGCPAVVNGWLVLPQKEGVVFYGPK